MEAGKGRQAGESSYDAFYDYARDSFAWDIPAFFNIGVDVCDKWAARLRAGEHNDLRGMLAQARLERYIGVIYRPQTERWSHYSLATLQEQYDAFAWFDQTRAVKPLPTPVTTSESETYPSGL